MPTARQFSDLLAQWIERRIPPNAAQWFAEARRAVTDAAGERELFLRLAMVSRKLGRIPLALEEGERARAEEARPGWRPDLWSTDEAARICLLLSACADGEGFARRLNRLCAAADVGELVAYYRGLPLYSEPHRHVARAAEGVRSNMRSVFEAVAHHNPYPAENLPEGAWNQMVLKALFIGSSLDPIEGLDRRANPALMRMLCDYAHERWAAQRPVSPELWRCVGPCADDSAIVDLERVLRSGDARERRAAWLSLSACPHPRAEALRRDAPGDLPCVDWAELAG